MKNISFNLFTKIVILQHIALYIVNISYHLINNKLLIIKINN